MSEHTNLRMMTYNVHSCLGRKGYDSLEDIIEVIKLYNPDIVCLQELDVHVARSGNMDQPAIVAERLAYHHSFFPARPILHGYFGNAIFSRFPLKNIQSLPLEAGRKPKIEIRQMINRPQESRSAVWVDIDHPAGIFHVLTTHLSLLRSIRELQIRLLLGEKWMGSIPLAENVIFAGDFNLTSRSKEYQILLTSLSDAQVDCGLKMPRATFPAVTPLRNIDHICYRGRMQPIHTFVPRIRLTRKASDHLPVVVDFDI